MNRKGLTAIIILIALLVVGGVWYYEAHKNVSTVTSPQATSTAPAASSTQTSAPSAVNCTSSAQYFVISSDLTDSVGSNILVKYKTSPGQVIPCVYTPASGDFELKDADAEYFFGLAGHFLVLDRGTGPEPRELIVYDLNSRQEVYSDQYSSPVIFATTTITYWTPVATKVTAANCPQLGEFSADDLGAEIESHVILNLPDLTETNLQEFRCSPTQGL